MIVNNLIFLILSRFCSHHYVDFNITDYCGINHRYIIS